MSDAPAKKLIIIGFDSISLPTLEEFVRRGALPTVGKLMEEGSVTQTWPCFPMETGTNWACLATGASPWVTGCNMSVHYPGDRLDERSSGFPASVCNAEQIWTTAHDADKLSIVFDWAQSFPLKHDEGIIHVGEDGRPDNAQRALQEVRAYATHPRQPGPHVTEIAPKVPEKGDAIFELPIDPGPQSRYKRVKPLHAVIRLGDEGFESIDILAAKKDKTPLLSCRLGEWTDWALHSFRADGRDVQAAVRAKLLKLSPDASEVHLYLSEIYCQEDFVQPTGLAPGLVEHCGPFIIQSSRQQVVQGGASDIATYFEEQKYLARWWQSAAARLLTTQAWDMFMLKWHGPDWTNHLTMYMIDPRHPMHEPDRADEGWAMWDELMRWGDDIVATALEAAGPDTLVALVSDHGGDTMLPGLHNRDAANAVLRERGWLVRGEKGIDWSESVALGTEHYVYLNVKGREPKGKIERGREYDELRDEIIEALLSAKDGSGRHVFRVVLPMEQAGRFAVGGDRVGDIFLLPAVHRAETATPRDEFWRTHTREQTGTWDWPRLNAGSHSDDAYFILSGPGVKSGYRRERPTLITSVAPTCATAFGIPVPADADGSVLWDFME
ncbi:MAG TPA: alkaline phosphatase family protein [Armatimonadota bacterium]|nr:alkaline phosphatase family protein [Armatimonadota bacterium]